MKKIHSHPIGQLQFDNCFSILPPSLSGAIPPRTLKQVSCGTELNITQEGLPALIPVEAYCLGWQESLVLLANLVEPEIPKIHAAIASKYVMV